MATIENAIDHPGDMSVPRCHENTAGRGSVELGANLFIPDLWKLNFAIPPDDRPAKYRSLPLPSGLAHKRHADDRGAAAMRAALGALFGVRDAC